MHRILRSALCLLLCALSVLPVAALGPHGAGFDAELQEMDEQYGLIPDSLKELDLTQPITRGEMCAVAVLTYDKLTGISHTAVQTDYFLDTDDPTVCAAFELGIVNGFADGTFRPNEHLTRAQFCKILYNLSQLLNTTFTEPADDILDQFVDADNISDTYLDAVELMVHLYVMRGNTSHQLQLTSDASRQEALVLFFRYYKREREAYAMQIESLGGGSTVTSDSADAHTAEMAALVDYAMDFIGTRYVYGGTTPNGFDCSGFVQYVFRQFGYTLNRVAEDQYNNGVYVDASELMPGDLVFFSNNGAQSGIYHVGIYIGDNQFVHAANSRRGVVISYLNEGYYAHYFYGARRILDS